MELVKFLEIVLCTVCAVTGGAEPSLIVARGAVKRAAAKTGVEYTPAIDSIVNVYYHIECYKPQEEV